MESRAAPGGREAVIPVGCRVRPTHHNDWCVGRTLHIILALKSGQIIDATFVPVPIQRNGRENNSIIKADAVPIDWGKTPAKLAQ